MLDLPALADDRQNHEYFRYSDSSEASWCGEERAKGARPAVSHRPGRSQKAPQEYFCILRLWGKVNLSI